MIEINVYYKKWYSVIRNPKNFVKKIINTSLTDLNIYEYNPTISIVLANNILLQKLNYEYNKKNKPTNVLSFSYNKLNKNCYLGEIFISLDILINESVELNIPIEHHTSHMLIHGLLHILDYDHEKTLDQYIMESIEIKLLDKLGIKNPYVPRGT